MFIPRNKTPNQAPDPKALELERMKNTINDDCDKWHSLTINSKNILIRNDLGDSQLQMVVHPAELKRSLFVGEG